MAGKSGTPAVLKKIKQLVSDRNLDEAKSLLLQTIEQDPGNATFLLIMSKLLTLTKDYRSALIFAERAIKSDPLNALALLQQANIRFKESDLKGALESVSAALSLDPRSLQSFHLQQRIYSKMSEYGQLIAGCERCLSMYPFDPRSYLNKATGFTKQGRLQDAEELINSATLMVPESSALYAELGNIYSMQGLHSKAILAYQQSVAQQKKTRPLTYLKLAKAFLEVNDYPQCRESLSEYDDALRTLKRKGISNKFKTRYQYTHDFLFACSLKGHSSLESYQVAVLAILRRMLVDNNTLHGVLAEPMSSDAISGLPFERVEELVIAGVKSFETQSKDNDDFSLSDMSDDELGEF
jgi:tetratricopeptide (TPR) repeat protein